MEDGIQIKKHLPHDYAVCRVNNLSFLLKQETGHFENMRDILGYAVAHSHSGFATINDPRIKFGRYLSMSLSFGIPCSIRGFFIHDCILSFLQDRAWIFVMCKSYCNSIHSIFLGYGKVWLQSDISFQPRMVGLGGRTIPLIEAVLHGCSFFLSIMKK